MFLEKDFKYIPLVLALLAYLGAVRIAIRQRLGALLLEMHTDKKAAKWSRLAKSAKSSSRALMLLIPADVMFVGVAFLLLCKLLGRPDGGSMTMAIESGIMIGGAWLLFLHLNEWYLGYSPATKEREPPPAEGAAPPLRADKQDPFCTKLEYWCALVIPMLVLVVVVGLSISAKNRSKDAMSRYELSPELLENAIRIDQDDASARHRYALAQGRARKNSNHSPLKAPGQSIEIDARFRDKAKSKPDFESTFAEGDSRELVDDP